MPEPVPAPTAEQLVIVAEIAMVSVDEATSMVASDTDQAVSDAKWARTLLDIERWDDIQTEGGELKRVGDIEFFQGKNLKIRLDFRNMIRARYGLPLIAAETSFATWPVSAAVTVSPDY